jgi:hypothetical protein
MAMVGQLLGQVATRARLGADLGLHALQRILENPEDASELLYSLSKMDPDLVKKVRSLDRQSRAILLAMSGD